jgi:hypothetical protein
LQLIRAMKKAVAVLLVAIAFYACKGNKKVPDISKVNVDMKVMDFSKDFFSLDTNHLDAGLQQLYLKHGHFANDYLYNIVGCPPSPDTTMLIVKWFMKDYSNVYMDASKQFADLSPTVSKINEGLRFVKHYFPKYPLPDTLITYIGPWDASVVLSNQAVLSNIKRLDNKLCIGLQLFMGKDYSVYKEDGFRNIYPDYVSRRFDKEYIAVNAIKVIVDDMYPTQSSGKTLIEQMVEAGKRLYLLDAFLPHTADTLKTGYTEEQLKGCYENESNIWSLFVNNDLLFTTNPSQMKDYMNDAPNTAVLGEKSPGMIGHFTGWQIVKKWMEKHEKTTLEQLMKIPAKQIFEESKYKPK